MASIPKMTVSVRMLNGTEYPDILVVTADRMRLASHAQREKWGSITEDPDRSVTFLAWAALRRLGQFTGTFSTFISETETVAAPEPEDEDELDVVDPTQPVTR